MARVYELTTPLGKDVLLFRFLRGREALARLSAFDLSALSTRSDIAPGALLGKSVSVKVELGGGGFRYLHGYVTRFSQEAMVGRYHQYRFTVHPWLWFLTRTSDCRIFQDKTVPDIVKQIFGKHPTAAFEDGLTGTYARREYCVQYRETDFDFVSRLMEEEGMYYYFEHSESRHVLKMVDSYAGHKALEGKASIAFYPPGKQVRVDEEFIHEWTFAQSIQPGVVELDDYDFTRPRMDLKVKARVLQPHDAADYEWFDAPGEYKESELGERLARARADEFHSEFDQALAACNVRELAVGRLFTLTPAPRRDQEREYLIVAADYDLRDNAYETSPEEPTSYRCGFTALPSRQQFRPARATPRPIVRGPQTAVVVGPPGEEIWTDQYGRVKVLFHWDRHGQRDQNASCWMRVSYPWAGQGWGAVSIPRIGQEVIVDFLEGDPDQPIITGRVYNADNMPPYALPGSGVISGIKSDTHKGQGYNEISLDDTAGKEKITIHGQYDMNTTIEHDQTNLIRNHRSSTIESGNDALTVSSGTRTVTVKGDTSLTVQAGNRTVSVTGGDYSATSTSGAVFIKGATQITLQCGGSTIQMDPAKIVLNSGSGQLVLDASGATLKGALVKIN
jgi:type VI secretion system secreted protein VgrG